jgi:hypothetical protein
MIADQPYENPNEISTARFCGVTWPPAV